ncbi:MAG: hypothetical protein ACRDRW_19140 [Pseudonocardiaceae bacterium]
MSDALSFAELDGQQVELLPTRTVLSTFTHGTNGGDATGTIGVATSFLGNLIHGNSYGTPGTNANA